jgi:hypothetical protein
VLSSEANAVLLIAAGIFLGVINILAGSMGRFGTSGPWKGGIVGGAAVGLTTTAFIAVQARLQWSFLVSIVGTSAIIAVVVSQLARGRMPRLIEKAGDGDDEAQRRSQSAWETFRRTRRSHKLRRLASPILAILALSLSALAIAVATGEEAPEPAGTAGTILSPESGTRVSRTITVEGTVSGIPPEKHVWVAVQIGKQLFPKEPEIPSTDQHWIIQIVEGGNPPDGTLSLALLMVDASGNRYIKNWLNEPDRRGLHRIPGSVRLDMVRDLVLG